MKPEQFKMNHWAIHEAPDSCKICAEVQAWIDQQTKKG